MAKVNDSENVPISTFKGLHSLNFFTRDITSRMIIIRGANLSEHALLI